MVEFKGVSFHYPDGHHAMGDVSFNIKNGETVGIIGANGAGKSTLLMLLMGILSPSNGTIHVEDIQVMKKNLPRIREKIGMVFQNPDDQLFMTTVYDDVAFGPRNYGLDEETVAKRVMDALEVIEITHLKDRAPYKLSGGEKRSVAISSVLSMEPKVLVMDEPTSNLDPKSRRRLINLLRDLEYTKIIATHDLDMVLDLCDRVIVLKQGQVFMDGKAQKILASERLMDECELEIPLSLQNCPLCSTR